MSNTFSIKVALKLLTDNFEQGINKASRATKSFSKGGNDMFGSMLKGISGLLPAIGAAAVATTVFKGVIATTQTAGDAWALTTASVTGALEGMYRTIGSGDYSNLFDNMVKSSKAARELTAALDELFEKGLGKDLNNSEIDVKIATAESLRMVAKANKDYTEVVKQANTIAALEMQKIDNSMNVAQATKKAFFDDIKAITGKDDTTILNFLKSYSDTNVTKIREEATAYLDEVQRIKTSTGTVMNSSAGAVFMPAGKSAIEANIDALKKNYSQEVIIYAATLSAYNTLNDEKIKSATGAEIAINNLKTNSIRQQEANESAKAKALLREDDLGNKQDDKKQKALEDRIDAEKRLQLEIIKVNQLEGNYKAKGRGDYAAANPVGDGGKNTTDFQANKLQSYSNAVTALGNSQQILFNSSLSGWQNITNGITNTQFLAEQTSTAIDGLTDAFSGLFEGTEGGFKNMVTSMLGGIQQIINALLAQAIAAMIAGEAHKGIVGLATGAIGVAVLAGLWKSKVPAFENGGIVGGSSFTGDRVPVLTNSREMILNQSQQANLFNMANTGSGSNGGGTVDFRIEGNALVGVLNNHNKRMNNFK